MTKGITLNEYQLKAYSFAAYGDATLYPFTALSEEAGEVAGKLAKYQRKEQTNTPNFLGDSLKETQLREDLKKELGDVLWQLSACCCELGVNLENVALMNLEKLGGREERGTIIGTGDER
jgi:NTP pyrophosphatase (non-canonical NTP hydrolase)